MTVTGYDWPELHRRTGDPRDAAYGDRLTATVDENPDLISEVPVPGVAELDTRVTALEQSAGNGIPWVLEPTVEDSTERIRGSLAAYGIAFLIGDHVTSEPITITDRMIVDGPGQIVNHDSDLFVLTGSHWKIRNVKLWARGGHTFRVAGCSRATIDNVRASAEPAAKSVWYQVGLFGAYDMDIHGGEWIKAPGMTAPIMLVDVPRGFFNSNTIAAMRMETNGEPQAPAVSLRCTQTDDWLNANLFQGVNFERPVAGAVHAFGCFGLVLDRCEAWDILDGSTSDDLWVLDRGGAMCANTSLRNVNRHASTLGDGLFDINVKAHYAGNLLVDNCGSSRGAAVHRIPAAYRADVRGGFGSTIIEDGS